MKPKLLLLIAFSLILLVNSVDAVWVSFIANTTNPVYNGTFRNGTFIEWRQSPMMTGNYNLIITKNNSAYRPGSNTTSDAFVFVNFTIGAYYEKINVTVWANISSLSTSNIRISLWNFTSSNWVNLSSGGTTANNRLSINVTPFSNFVSSNNIRVRVSEYSPVASRTLWVDYLGLNVSYEQNTTVNSSVEVHIDSSSLDKVGMFRKLYQTILTYLGLSTSVSQSIPQIVITLFSPTTNMNATKSQFFNVTVNVSCYNSNCGDINVSLDPLGFTSPSKYIISVYNREYLKLSLDNGLKISYEDYFVTLKPQFTMYSNLTFDWDDIPLSIQKKFIIERNGADNYKYSLEFSNVSTNIRNNLQYVSLKRVDYANITEDDVRVEGNKVIIKDLELSHDDLLSSYQIVKINKSEVIIGGLDTNWIPNGDGTYNITFDPTIYAGKVNSSMVLNNITCDSYPSCHVTTDSTVLLYMPFDINKSGTVYDYQGRAWTRIGNSNFSLSPYGLAYNSEYIVSGTYLTTQMTPELNVSRNFTIAGWYYANNDSRGYHGIIYAGTAFEGAKAKYRIYMDVRDSSNIRSFHFIMSNSTTDVDLQTNPSLDPTLMVAMNQWFQFVATCNDTKMTLYINGTQKGSTTTAPPVGTYNSISGIYVGAGDIGNPVGLNGSLDELTIYNYSMNSSQVLQLFNNQTNRFKTPSNQTYTIFTKGFMYNSSLVSGLGTTGDYATPAVFNYNDGLYLLSNSLSGFVGYSHNGTGWIINNSIKNGLGYPTALVTPSVFYYNSGLYLIHGGANGIFYGYHHNGTGWITNNSIVANIPDLGTYSSPEVFNYSGGLHLLASDHILGKFLGFTYNSTGWATNSTINNSISNVGNWSFTSVFNYNSGLYALVGNDIGLFIGYSFNGTGWSFNRSFNSSMQQNFNGGSASSPEVFYLNNFLVLISGDVTGNFFGWSLYNFTNSKINITTNTSLFQSTNISIQIFQYSNLINIDSSEIVYLSHGNNKITTWDLIPGTDSIDIYLNYTTNQYNFYSPILSDNLVLDIWQVEQQSIKSGLVSTIFGDTPFYTNGSNPINISLNAGQSQLVTFWVNATGTLYNNYTFFAYANKTSSPEISNITSTFNVTIVSTEEPSSASYYVTTSQSVTRSSTISKLSKFIKTNRVTLLFNGIINDLAKLFKKITQAINPQAIFNRIVKLFRNLYQSIFISPNLETVYIPIAGDTVYPTFDNIIDNNGTVIGSGMAKFYSEISNTNGTAFVGINGQNYSALQNNYTWINFNGNSSNVTIPDNPYYSINKTNELTVSLWLYVPSFAFVGQKATSHYINYFQKKSLSATNCEWEFRMYNSTGLDGAIGSYNRTCRLSFYTFNATCALGAGADVQLNDTEDSCPSLENKWLHLVGGLDSTTNSSFIYVNGIRSIPSAATQLSYYGLTIMDTPSNITIGRDLDSTSPWLNASMDEIKIFNKTLTNGEVKQLRDAGRENKPVIKKEYNDTWLNFTSQKQYVFTEYNSWTNETTFTGWFIRNNNDTQDLLVGSYNSVGMLIRLEANRALRFYANTTSGTNVVGITSNNEWMQYALTFNNSNGNVTLYINGAINNSVITSVRYTNPSNLLLGKRGTSQVSDMLDGQLDEFRMYNKILNNSDVLQLYQNGRKENQTILRENLSIYYPMNEGEYNGTLFDDSGNGNDGIIYDAQWVNDGIITSQYVLPSITSTVVGEWDINESSGTKIYDSSGYSNNGTLYNVSWGSNLSNLFVSSMLLTTGVYPYYWGSWGNGTNHNYNTSTIRYYTVTGTITSYIANIMQSIVYQIVQSDLGKFFRLPQISTIINAIATKLIKTTRSIFAIETITSVINDRYRTLRGTSAIETINSIVNRIYKAIRPVSSLETVSSSQSEISSMKRLINQIVNTQAITYKTSKFFRKFWISFMIGEGIDVSVFSPTDTTKPWFEVIPDGMELPYGLDISEGGIQFIANDNVAINAFHVNDSRFTIGTSYQFLEGNWKWVGNLGNSTVIPVGNYSLNISIDDTAGNWNYTIYSLNITPLAISNYLVNASSVLTINSLSVRQFYATKIIYGVLNPVAILKVVYKGTRSVYQAIFFTIDELDKLAAKRRISEKINVVSYTNKSRFVSKSISQSLIIKETTKIIAKIFKRISQVVNINLIVSRFSSKENGIVYAYINGQRGDVTLTPGSTANITGVLVTGVGQIQMYINGVLYNNGSSPITNITTLQIGVYLVNITYIGNENFYPDEEVWTITVIPTSVAAIPICKYKKYGYYNLNIPFMKPKSCTESFIYNKLNLPNTNLGE
jgi:hypothetical protein